jgi:hypothetical protein
MKKEKSSTFVGKIISYVKEKRHIIAIVIILGLIATIIFEHNFFTKKIKLIPAVTVQELKIPYMDADIEYDPSMVVTTAYSKNIMKSFVEKGTIKLSEDEQQLIVELVTKYSMQYNIPKSTLYTLIYAESRGDTKAYSTADAIGLTQVTQPALTEYNKEMGTHYVMNDLYDIVVNLSVGVWYFNKLKKDYSIDNWELTYMCYFNGPGNYVKYSSYYRTHNFLTEGSYNSYRNWLRSQKFIADAISDNGNQYFRIELR